MKWRKCGERERVKRERQIHQRLCGQHTEMQLAWLLVYHAASEYQPKIQSTIQTNHNNSQSNCKTIFGKVNRLISSISQLSDFYSQTPLICANFQRNNPSSLLFRISKMVFVQLNLVYRSLSIRYEKLFTSNKVHRHTHTFSFV